MPAGTRRAGAVLPAATLWLGLLLVGCSDAPPPESAAGTGGDSSAETQAQTPEQMIAALDAANVNPVSFAEVSATFELGSRATDLQRERMHAALQDQVVEWDLEVYEVRARDANYEIVSEPTSARHSDATALLRVVATVIPRNDADRALIEALQTGSRIRLRGLLTGISLRIVVGMSPAVVVVESERAQQL
jgi:hypothetical protein